MLCRKGGARSRYHVAQSSRLASAIRYGMRYDMRFVTNRLEPKLRGFRWQRKRRVRYAHGAPGEDQKGVIPNSVNYLRKAGRFGGAPRGYPIPPRKLLP